VCGILISVKSSSITPNTSASILKVLIPSSLLPFTS
jgi:hypothetical protein